MIKNISLFLIGILLYFGGWKVPTAYAAEAPGLRASARPGETSARNSSIQFRQAQLPSPPLSNVYAYPASAVPVRPPAVRELNPVGAAQDSVLAVARISVRQATLGWPLPLTPGQQPVIKVENDAIVNAWVSEQIPYQARFVPGGSLLMLETRTELEPPSPSSKTPGMLLVQLRSGESLIFPFTATAQAGYQVLAVYREEAPKLLLQQQVIAALGQPTPQENPVALPETVESGVRQPTSSPGSKTGYWLLDRGLANPQVWQSGPDAPAYRAFFTYLQQGKDTDSPFPQTLSLAQRLSGLSDANLVWLSRSLADRGAP